MKQKFSLKVWQTRLSCGMVVGEIKIWSGFERVEKDGGYLSSIAIRHSGITA